MKKIISIILLLGIAIISLTGCSLKNDSRIGNLSDININNNDIIVSIKDDTLTNKGATFIIENNSDKLVGYSESYHLEIKDNNEWHILKTINDAEFNEPLWNLESNNTKEIEVNWEYIYGNLEAGEYRFIKDSCFINENETFDDFYIGVKFTIS